MKKLGKQVGPELWRVLSRGLIINPQMILLSMLISQNVYRDGPSEVEWFSGSLGSTTGRRNEE